MQKKSITENTKGLMFSAVLTTVFLVGHIFELKIELTVLTAVLLAILFEKYFNNSLEKLGKNVKFFISTTVTIYVISTAVYFFINIARLV